MNATAQPLDNRRVAAAIVDLLIVVAVAAVILYAGDALAADGIQGALAVVVLGWALYYYFALESGDGQTVGKKLMKLRVVCVDGRPAGMREIAVRTVLRVVDGIGAYVVGLVVMLATGRRRQRLGDLAAGTIVVDADAPAVTPAVAAPVAGAEAETELEGADYEQYGEADDAGHLHAGHVDAEYDDAVYDDADYDDAEPAAPEPVETITLPARPAPPAAVAEPEPEPEAAAPADEPAPYEPAVELAEPAVESFEPAVVEDPEPAVEDFEPAVEDFEPAVEDFEPAVDASEPVVEVSEPAPVEQAVAEEAPGEPLPDIASPSLEELARDVRNAQGERDDEPGDADQPMTVKSVETVSAMDLIMGAEPDRDSDSR